LRAFIIGILCRWSVSMLGLFCILTIFLSISGDAERSYILNKSIAIKNIFNEL